MGVATQAQVQIFRQNVIELDEVRLEAGGRGNSGKEALRQAGVAAGIHALTASAGVEISENGMANSTTATPKLSPATPKALYAIRDRRRRRRSLPRYAPAAACRPEPATVAVACTASDDLGCSVDPYGGAAFRIFARRAYSFR